MLHYLIVYFVLDSVVAEICNGEVWSHYFKSLFIDEDDVPSWITSEAVHTLNFRNSSWCRWCQNPELIVEQFKHSSKNLLLMQMVSHPGHGTKIARGNDKVQKVVLLMFTYIALIYTSIWCCKSNPGHGTKICKRMGWYFMISYCLLGLFLSSKIMKPGATRCYGTRVCKRYPSTSLYELLSL